MLNNQHLTCIHELCADTGRYLEDLPNMMADRERRQEKIKRIHAVGMP